MKRKRDEGRGWEREEWRRLGIRMRENRFRETEAKEWEKIRLQWITSCLFIFFISFTHTQIINIEEENEKGEIKAKSKGLVKLL